MNIDDFAIVEYRVLLSQYYRYLRYTLLVIWQKIKIIKITIVTPLKQGKN